jgi:hypothetical protein
MAVQNIAHLTTRNSAYARHMKVSNKQELEARKKELEERLEKIQKMLELIEKNPEIEEFLDLNK